MTVAWGGNLNLHFNSKQTISLTTFDNRSETSCSVVHSFFQFELINLALLEQRGHLCLAPGAKKKKSWMFQVICFCQYLLLLLISCSLSNLFSRKWYCQEIHSQLPGKSFYFFFFGLLFFFGIIISLFSDANFECNILNSNLFNLNDKSKQFLSSKSKKFAKRALPSHDVSNTYAKTKNKKKNENRINNSERHNSK